MSEMEAPHNDDLRDRSIGDLMKQLSTDMSTLVRKEIELAKAEMSQKGKQATAGVAMFGGAWAAGMMALVAATLFLVFLLAEVMDVWVAALIVTVITGAVAYFLAMRGRDRMKEATPPIPEQTVETLKEDVQWAKNPRRSAQR